METNITIGSLTSIKKTKNNKWLFKCECGNEKEYNPSNLRYKAKHATDPKIPSCGCYKKTKMTKHGYNKHPIINAYYSMLRRCYNEKDPKYKYYGAKGVTVCDEWKNNAEAFYKWSIANGWKKGLSIDKDKNAIQGKPKIYSPETCEWITKKENSSLAAKTKKLKFTEQDANKMKQMKSKGISITMIAKEFNTSRATINWYCTHY